MGWEIAKSNLEPTWDQTGFVYVITIRQPFTRHTEVIILPRDESVFDILERSGIVV